eukprot:2779237-Prymnesium_polylepis.1
MEENAKQILWAHIPHLDANERGSESGCRRWMSEAVSYIYRPGRAAQASCIGRRTARPTTPPG